MGFIFAVTVYLFCRALFLLHHNSKNRILLFWRIQGWWNHLKSISCTVIVSCRIYWSITKKVQNEIF